MKSNFSRRAFLRWLSLNAMALTGHALLTGCKSVQTPLPSQAPEENQPADPTNAQETHSEQVSPSPNTQQNEAPANETASTPEPHPDLAVVHGADPEALVRSALDTLGGMAQFVKPGQRVLVKPNICNAYHDYQYASTTNPWVVGAVVKLCLEAGASTVKVMDFPFAGEASDAYRISGIEEQVLQAGGEMEPIARFRFTPVSIPNGQSLSEVNVYDEVLNADVLINIPIAKDHGLAKLTLGMKNLMGCIQNRPQIHSDIGGRLSDLLSFFKPDLTIIDAIRILVAHGPTGGNLNDVRQTDTLIAGRDVVATDSFAASLFGMIGTDLDYVRTATARGLGRSDLNQLNIKEYSLGG